MLDLNFNINFVFNINFNFVSKKKYIIEFDIDNNLDIENINCKNKIAVRIDKNIIRSENSKDKLVVIIFQIIFFFINIKQYIEKQIKKIPINFSNIIE